MAGYLSNLIPRMTGHYRCVIASTALAPAANAVMFALRWTNTTNILLLERLDVSVAVATAVTAQRLDPIVATIARSYTASDITNTVATTLTGNNQKMRTSQGTSLITDLFATNLAAGILGGTKTPDANAFASASLSGQSAISGLGTGLPLTLLYSATGADSDHPVILAANEGVLVSWGATALATGTIVVTLELEWAEGPTF